MDKTQDFDLAAFEDTGSADVTVKDPMTGESTAVVVTLAGPEHPARKRLLMNKQRRMRAQLQKTGKLVFQDPEEDEAEESEMLVACTLGWQNVCIGGVAVEFSSDAASKLYADPKRRWLRDQLKAALDERENFIRRSAGS
jgi:hypothetical protein